MIPNTYFTNLDKPHDRALRGRFDDYFPKYTLDRPLPVRGGSAPSGPKKSSRHFGQSFQTVLSNYGGNSGNSAGQPNGGEPDGEDDGEPEEYTGAAAPEIQRERSIAQATRSTNLVDNEPGMLLQAGRMLQQPTSFKTIDSAYIPAVSTQFFSILICGASQSGKTQACLSILRHCVKKKMYDTYIIMSPTGHATEVWDPYIRHKDNIIGEYSDEALREIMDKQRETSKEKRKRIMLVIDDCISSAAIMAKSRVFSDLFALARNYSMSIMLLSQCINRQYVPKNARVNATWVMSCGLKSKTCMDVIRNDYLCPKSGDNSGLDMYESIIEGRYNFCAMNLRAHGAKSKEEWVHRYRAEDKIKAFTMNNDFVYSKIGRHGHANKRGTGLPSTSAPTAKVIKEKEYQEVFEERAAMPTYRKEKVLKAKPTKSYILY